MALTVNNFSTNERLTNAMKILFDRQLPFLLAHGGLLTQIERTKEALEQAGREVEYLRCWDDHQKGEVVH
jgi:hypothetical protein